MINLKRTMMDPGWLDALAERVHAGLQSEPLISFETWLRSREPGRK
jgi:hypothetical protein